jgi:outer membrane protein assembly factor BamB
MGGGSGSSVTAGGLLFRGEPDGNFVAVDAETGEVLWKFQTGFGADAPPIVYEVDGDEYIAIATGGNSIQRSATGDAVWAFSLKGQVGPAWWPPTPPPTGLDLGLYWRIRSALLSMWPGHTSEGHLGEPSGQGAHGDRGDR